MASGWARGRNDSAEFALSLRREWVTAKRNPIRVACRNAMRLSLPDMFSAGALHGIGRHLFCELLFADRTSLSHYVCHNFSRLHSSRLHVHCTSRAKGFALFRAP